MPNTATDKGPVPLTGCCHCVQCVPRPWQPGDPPGRNDYTDSPTSIEELNALLLSLGSRKPDPTDA